MSLIQSFRSVPSGDALRRSLRVVGLALTLNCVLYLALSLIDGQWLVDRSGRPVENDFVSVWAAGKLARYVLGISFSPNVTLLVNVYVWSSVAIMVGFWFIWRGTREPCKP